MIYTLTLRSKFSASHVLDGHLSCGKMHGHSFVVEITIVDDPEPETHNLVADDLIARSRLEEALAELNGRHLNDMLPAIIPSAQGVANWLWERLSTHYRMYEVTVWQDDLAASQRRERLGAA